MKCFRFFYLFLILFSISGFSQEKFTNHTVKKGETVSGIAKKYHIDPKVIFELNPNASKGLALNSILIIPDAATKSISVENNKIKTEEATHKVLPKETLFSIAKKYNIKVQDLYVFNPNLEKEGLKNGQLINVTKSNSVVEKVIEKGTATDSNKNIEDVIITKLEGVDYEVLPKETLYSIAKTYGISVERLEKANPILQTEGLKIGQKIIIPVKPYNPNTVVASPKEETKVVETPKATPVVEVKKTEVEKPKEKTIVATKPTLENSPKSTNVISTVSEGIDYEVLPKETLYSIAKTYGISVERLEKANPILQTEGLKIGQKIIIPVKPYNPNTVVASPKEETKVVETPKATPVVEVKKTEVEKPKEKTIVATKPTLENSPKSADVISTIAEGIDYEVLPKETLYSIAKTYGISVERLEKANPILQTEGLKIGQKIIIPVKPYNPNAVVASSKEELKTIENSNENSIINAKSTIEKAKKQLDKSIIAGEGYDYTVLPNESLFSIAKKNEISLDELKKANPSLKSQSLKRGQIITIPINNGVTSKVATAVDFQKGDKDVVSSRANEGEVKATENDFKHEVLSKETKYGIAKEYGITVKELEKQNPNISKNLSVGTVLNIRSSKIPIQEDSKEEVIAEKNSDETKKISPANDSEFVDQLIQTVSENIGARYRTGGTSKDGFDCSGLICTAFKAYDIQLPRTSFEQSQFGIVVNKEEAKKGDLIFFKTNGRRQINHVGMVVEVGDGDIKFIHASVSGGVMISSVNEKYYVKRFSQINRVLNN